jgi:hypothetical protein
LEKKLRQVARRAPGALIAFVLQHAYESIHLGEATRLKETDTISLSTYLSTKSLLKDSKDEKTKSEAQTLAEALDNLRKGKLQKCADLLAMRFLALESANAPAGQWKKAALYELKKKLAPTLAGV